MSDEERTPNRKRYKEFPKPFNLSDIHFCISDILFPIHYCDLQVSEELKIFMGKRCIAAEIKATMDVAKIPVYLTFYAFIKCTTLQEKYDVSQIPSYTL